MRAFLAAAFRSDPAAFLSFACLAAAFCWDWIFCCPRAMSHVAIKYKIHVGNISS